MKVKVKKMFPPGHVRTPSYLRGKIGEVERDLGYFKNPEELAYGANPRPGSPIEPYMPLVFEIELISVNN